MPSSSRPKKGGSFFGGRYPLYAEMKTKTKKGKGATALVVGGRLVAGSSRVRVAGLSFRSVGAALRFSADKVYAHAGPAGPARSGRGRWSNVVDQIGDEFPDIAVKALDRVVE